MALIIPGVEIRVIKELVPRQLAAPGVVGIVGHTEIDRSDQPLQGVASLAEFRDRFGAGSVAAMPEVSQIFANGAREIWCANLPSESGARARSLLPLEMSQYSSEGASRVSVGVRISARANGVFANGMAVRFVTKEVGSTTSSYLVDVAIFRPGAAEPAETFRNLTVELTSERNFVTVVNANSALVSLTVGVLTGSLVPTNKDPDGPLTKLESGMEAAPQAYALALERLESVPNIDLVTVSCDYGGSVDGSHASTTTVAAAVVSHCQRMSEIARNRLGFGQVPRPAGASPDLEKAKTMASTLTSERFVLVAPHGYLGAVVGRVAGLLYFESPTFKTLAGVTDLSFDFSDPQLRELLEAGVLPVDRVPRKGIAVVRGIFTDNSQISVQRIADQAVRQVQNIAQDFIGLLNTHAQRLALKQLIIGAFTNMYNEGALVPSTDGKSPPFQVDVECSGLDFAQGIVRVHCAVRPVRAIDYIYATILVKAA